MSTHESTRAQHRRMTSTVLFSFILEIFNKVSPFVVLRIAQQRLGIASFGYAQFMMLVFETAMPFINVGYYMYAGIEIGRRKDDLPSVRGIVSAVLALKAVHGVVLLVLGAIAFYSLPGLAEYRFGMTVLSFVMLGYVLDTYFVHLGTQTLSLMTAFIGVSKIICLAAMLRWVRDPSDAILYAALSIGANTMTSLLSFRYSLRRIGLRLPTRDELRAVWKGSLPFGAVVLVAGVVERADVFIVEAFLGSAGVGLYSAPLRVASGILPLVVGLGSVFLAELVSTFDPKAFSRHVEQATWVLLSIVMPLVAGSWFVDQELMTLILGTASPEHGRLFSLFVAGIGAFAMTSIYGFQVLALRNRRRLLVKGMLVGGSVGFMLSIALAPAWGLLGIALGASLGKVVIAALVTIGARSQLHGLPWQAGWVTATAAGAMVVALALVPGSSLLVRLSLGAGVYAFVLISLAWPHLQRLRGDSSS